MNFKKELLLYLELSENQQVRKEYEERIAKGGLTRDENPVSHFCAYFLPFNPESKKVLLGHHKKSGLWLSPGGHFNKEESFLEALNREIEEELGVKKFFKEKPEPFLLTVTNIKRDTRACKKHFDVWFLMETDGNDFNVDMDEYHGVKWLTIPKALELTTDEANRSALKRL